MRKTTASLLAFILLGGLYGGSAIAHDGDSIAVTRQVAFPKLPDGRFVLAVDLHTHSVFSDGNVWPDIRVGEAKRDGLYAMAVTEHLEYQPHAADIPHPDRNRSFQLATAAAAVKPDATGPDARPLMVIAGVEVTKASMPPGHINAVFITNANALKDGDVTTQLKAAKAQDAFTFWNHPYWYAQKADGLAAMTPLHQQLIKDGLLNGIEVANGADMSDEAFRIALDNNLTILGTSDIHGLIDWDYDLQNGAHRTSTLVLTMNQTTEGLKAALKAGQTVAYYKDNLIGRPMNVEALVRGTLKAEIGAPLPKSTVYAVNFVNSSPMDYTLENTGKEGFYNQGRVITVKARSTLSVLASNVADPSKLGFTLKVMNTWVAPQEHLTLRLATTKPN